MNKTQKIILVAVLVIVVIVAVVLVVNNNKKEKSNISVSSANDLIDVVNKLYKGKDLPNLDTNSIDVSDEDLVNAYTGLENGNDLEYLVVSEPLMSSQAYSLVIAKVKNGKADSVAKSMSEKINMAKWICVSAEKLYATSSGDLAFLVMSSEEWAKPVYDAFKKEAGTIGKEYNKEESAPNFDDFMMPDEDGEFVITEDNDFLIPDEEGDILGGDSEYEPTEVIQ